MRPEICVLDIYSHFLLVKIQKNCLALDQKYFGVFDSQTLQMAQTSMASSLKPLKALNSLKRWKTRQDDIKKQRFSSKSFYFNQLIDQASKAIKNRFDGVQTEKCNNYPKNEDFQLIFFLNPHNFCHKFQKFNKKQLYFTTNCPKVTKFNHDNLTLFNLQLRK